MQTRRFPQIPERIQKLEDLAYNLKWSWDYRARLLFKRLDPELWKNNQHNPVKLLHEIDPQRLLAAARDPDFLREYEVTMKNLDRGKDGVRKGSCVNFPIWPSNGLPIFPRSSVCTHPCPFIREA